MATQIVTLIADWGNKDGFAGKVKGRLYSNLDQVNVVDIATGIDPFDLRSAAFVLKSCFDDFPKGTIHIVDVCPNNSDSLSNLIVEVAGQYVLCADTLLPWYAFGDRIDKAWRINLPDHLHGDTFTAYTILTPIAVAIVKGHKPESLGTLLTEQRQISTKNPFYEGDRLVVYVSHIDNYGNVYLNITVEEFERHRNGRSFVLTMKERSISTFVDSYQGSDNARQISRSLVVLPSVATGLVEVAFSCASVAKIMGMQVDEMVWFTFK